MSKLDDFGTTPQKTTKGRKVQVEVAEKQPLANEENCKETNKLRRTQWAIVGSGQYMACSSTIGKLRSGAYGFIMTNEGNIICRENPINTDELIHFPDSTFDKITKEVESFWKLNESFSKYGFLHRRGYLFYGPAGSGKSCLIQQLMQDVIDKDGVIFICDVSPSIFALGLKVFREVEPDRKIICIFEDVDALIEQRGEAEFLSLLDGENQVDKVINIATTNYPEKLDKRIVARPRRFDQVVKIGMPSDKMRRVYFKEKLRINGDDLKLWVEKSSGLSFAALAEMVISVKCLKNDFDETVEKLKEMSGTKISSSGFDNSSIGFGTDKK